MAASTSFHVCRLATLVVRTTIQQSFLRQISVMVSLATCLSELSDRADKLLETHHQELFDLGLDVSFNRATLATKYWLPLPESDKPTHRTDAPRDEYALENDDQLLWALNECEITLQQMEKSFKAPSKKPFGEPFEGQSEWLLERNRLRNMYACWPTCHELSFCTH
jgi:hypothetical protein